MPHADLRDALRHAHVLYTKADAQRDKMATVVGETKLTTLATTMSSGEIILVA